MLWFFWRWLFWRPRFSYVVLAATSHASADEAARNAQLQIAKSGGEAIGIAADALCCCGEEGQRASVEFNVYALVRF